MHVCPSPGQTCIILSVSFAGPSGGRCGSLHLLGSSAPEFSSLMGGAWPKSVLPHIKHQGNVTLSLPGKCFSHFLFTTRTIIALLKQEQGAKIGLGLLSSGPNSACTQARLYVSCCSHGENANQVRSGVRSRSHWAEGSVLSNGCLSLEPWGAETRHLPDVHGGSCL